MIVQRTWIRTITIIIAVTSSINGKMLDFTTSTESSSDYLRKVMLELRDLNLPPSSVSDRPVKPFYFDVDDRLFLAGKRYSNGKHIIQKAANQLENSGSQKLPLHQSTGKKLQPVALDQTVAGSETHNQYYQVPAIAPAPQKVISTEASGLTKAQLAAAYKEALGQGGVVNLNALANVMRHNHMSSAVKNQPELAETQPMYSYYFYPMKSLMNDMRQNVQTHVLPLMPELIQQPNWRPHNTEVAQESQKEIGNPLFMAISGFISMAVIFMIGVLLFPPLMDFNSRISNEDKYLHLTKHIGEAIDFQNSDEIKDFDKRAAIRKPAKIARPSSVVMITNNTIRRKNAKNRRRKINEICKNGICKKSHRSTPT